MKKTVKIISPSYMEEFQCIGGKCEDNCCIGWDIDIDKETFKKYHKITDENMRKICQKSVQNNLNYTNKDLDYGKIKLNKDNRCPLLDENNFCTVHSKLGEDYLSSVCTQFPRVLNKIDDFYEISLDTSCPESARIVLGNPEKIKFKETKDSINKYTLAGILDTKSSEFNGTPIKYFKEIRDFSISIIQNRNLKFSTRLYVLGDFLDKLEDTETSKIKQFISKYDVNAVAKSYRREDMNYVLQVSFFKDIIELLDIQNSNDSNKLKDYTSMLLKGYNIEHNENIILNKEKYINAFTKYTEEYIEKYSYIFENYIVNFMYSNLFPFSESDSMFDGFIMILFRYSLIRFYLVGKFLHIETDSTKDIIEFIRVFVKSIEHDTNYRIGILGYIKSNSFDNMEFAKMIL